MNLGILMNLLGVLRQTAQAESSRSATAEGEHSSQTRVRFTQFLASALGVAAGGVGSQAVLNLPSPDPPTGESNVPRLGIGTGPQVPTTEVTDDKGNPVVLMNAPRLGVGTGPQVPTMEVTDDKGNPVVLMNAPLLGVGTGPQVPTMEVTDDKGNPVLLRAVEATDEQALRQVQPEADHSGETLRSLEEILSAGPEAIDLGRGEIHPGFVREAGFDMDGLRTALVPVRPKLEVTREETNPASPSTYQGHTGRLRHAGDLAGTGGPSVADLRMVNTQGTAVVSEPARADRPTHQGSLKVTTSGRGQVITDFDMRGFTSSTVARRLSIDAYDSTFAPRGQALESEAWHPGKELSGLMPDRLEIISSGFTGSLRGESPNRAAADVNHLSDKPIHPAEATKAQPVQTEILRRASIQPVEPAASGKEQLEPDGDQSSMLGVNRPVAEGPFISPADSGRTTLAQSTGREPLADPHETQTERPVAPAEASTAGSDAQSQTDRNPISTDLLARVFRDYRRSSWKPQTVDNHIWAEHGDAGGRPVSGTGSADSQTHTTLQQVYSTIIEQVDAARAKVRHEARFGIRTENGQTIQVRMTVNSNLVTARISVSSMEMKDVLANHVWELNQRLENEGLVPEDIEFCLLGESGGNSRRDEHRKSRSASIEGTSATDKDESILVEATANAFDRWA